MSIKSAPPFDVTRSDHLTEVYQGFDYHRIDEEHSFHTGRLPTHLLPIADQFETVWELHPEEYHTIMMHGRPVKTPRWQQAFGRDYYYTGKTNSALPIPVVVQPILDWSRAAFHQSLNGLLLNWYDGRLGHYIGKHRDSTKNMVNGAPIVTISFGEERLFRLRPWKATGFRDFPATDGSIFVMPYETNLAWTHEVPHSKKNTGRRISITLRAFHD